MSEPAAFDEDDLLPISALQHLVYCERQCLLIHLERIWTENRQTAEGRQLHERTHLAGAAVQGSIIVARGLHLASRRLGLSGIADVTEFHFASDPNAGVVLPGREGCWRAFPVEFKRGRPKPHNADAVQLCETEGRRGDASILE